MKSFVLVVTFLALMFTSQQAEAQLFRRGFRIQTVHQVRPVQTTVYSQSTRVLQNISHNCPRCGTLQYVIAGYNQNGTHNHVCPRCRTSWSH